MVVKVNEDADSEKIDVVIQALKGLDFGELHITVHDGKIVQIDRTEKKRFPALKTENKK